MKIRTLTETDAEAIATWRSPGRYQTYDVSEVVTSEAGFWAVGHEATRRLLLLRPRGTCSRRRRRGGHPRRRIRHATRSHGPRGWVASSSERSSFCGPAFLPEP